MDLQHYEVPTKYGPLHITPYFEGRWQHWGHGGDLHGDGWSETGEGYRAVDNACRKVMVSGGAQPWRINGVEYRVQANLDYRKMFRDGQPGAMEWSGSVYLTRVEGRRDGTWNAYKIVLEEVIRAVGEFCDDQLLWARARRAVIEGECEQIAKSIVELRNKAQELEDLRTNLAVEVQSAEDEICRLEAAPAAA